MNYIYELPTSVDINGKEYKIRNNGDYRIIIDIMCALLDSNLSDNEKMICLVQIFYEDWKTIISSSEDDYMEAIKRCYEFIDCGQEQEDKQSNSPRLMDWEQDANLIIPAINRVAGQEVRALPYLHWWTFIGYYNEIGECSFSTIVGIRNKQSKGKKLEKWEQDYVKDNKNIVELKRKHDDFDNDMLDEIMGK